MSGRGVNGFSVAGRIACVTGASSGLGRLAALFLARAGARVVGIARDADRLEELRRDAGEGVATVKMDLAVLTGPGGAGEDIASRIAAAFGPPSILVNAAGVNLREPVDEVTRDSWQRTIDLNLAAPFFLARHLVPAMRDAGWGRIVNFASLQSRRAFPDGLPYGASKGGVEQLTRAMAETWSRDGIVVNALAPGFFPTPLTAPVFADADAARRIGQQTCIGRNGEPEDLEGPLLFLCSDACRYVTGQVLFVDGGFTAK